MSNYYGSRYTFDNGRAKVWKAITEYLQRFVDPHSATVVDLGAGYCDFINHIKAKHKYAVDINEDSRKYCGAGVNFLSEPINALVTFADHSVDVVFASNLLEHLNDAELDSATTEFKRILKPGGRVVLVQPNYRYAYKEYFDDYTHKKVFSHISLNDYFNSRGYETESIEPRFLPFSLKSRLPKSYFLTKLYLYLFYRPFAKQMMLVFKSV
jgi:predicted SAM-dependent methyltransferase